MPILAAKLDSETIIRFVGPYRKDEDHKLLAFNERKKEPGPLFRIEKKSRDSLVLTPYADPDKWLRYPIRSGLVERFVVYEKARDTVAAAEADIDERAKEFKEHFGEHIKAFDERQLTPEEKAEAEKMLEMRRKLHEINERQKAERSKDVDQRGKVSQQPPTGGEAG